jgi:hypothetical protein
VRRPKSSKWCIACLCALTATLALSPVAVASPQEVIADWNVDGFIQGHYSIGDLRNAPLLMQRLDPARVGPFLVVVNEKIDQDVLGIDPPGETGGPSSTPPVGDLPTWLVASAFGAALVAAGGVGSAIYRRTRRSEIP